MAARKMPAACPGVRPCSSSSSCCAALEAHRLGAAGFSRSDRTHLLTSFDLVNGQTVIDLLRNIALANDKDWERDQ